MSFSNSRILLLAGVNHADPEARRSLAERLTALKARWGHPQVIYLEWSEKWLVDVIAQREYFKRAARLEWASATDELLEELGDTIGFEADLPRGLFPLADCVWLDERRELSDPRAVIDFANNRLAEYSACLRGASPPGETERSIALISAEIRRRAEQFRGGGEDSRDLQWSRIIRRSLPPSGWSLCVLGAWHTQSRPGSLRTLLADLPLTVNVEYFPRLAGEGRQRR